MLRRLLALPLVAVLWSVFAPAQVTGLPAVGVHSARFADGLAVEVVGDPATAATVVVLVPGVATTAGNFDRGLGGVQRRAPAWQARQLATRAADLRAAPAGRSEAAPGRPAARRDGVAAGRDGVAAGRDGVAAGRDGVAVIAWLGYHPPSGIRLDAVREDAAASGADALLRFLRDVDAPRLVLVGHSYGSTVIGLAAGRLDAGTGGRVTDIVALGSPGMGVDRAADLRTTARVWAGSAPRDWTRRLPGLRVLGAGHGTHPTDPAFGAAPLPVDGVTGHDGYFVPGTASLDALAAIANGDVDAAARHA
ncbi:alpha/beta hydrolase [Dactylosporangium sp. NPDC000521]|uniref:alpha/beta hydrolase n=1 Tax=Dactylosporangium sp. NPDC000521 TaxID=3363975 RepID=UPI0036AED56E